LMAKTQRGSSVFVVTVVTLGHRGDVYKEL
jgi:hypothetical protein